MKRFPRCQCSLSFFAEALLPLILRDRVEARTRLGHALDITVTYHFDVRITPAESPHKRQQRLLLGLCARVTRLVIVIHATFRGAITSGLELAPAYSPTSPKVGQ
ncbi:MAG: hypothetical protein K2K95_09455 [Muribaculaceae bacterium]|nr:hypothetical protein [Muribaculaceae bacterium]